MITKESIYIPYLNTNRTLHIYIPTHVNGPYDVLYMFDGHNLFNDTDATYGKSWGLASYFDQHNIPLMIVGVECNHNGNQRLCEFCPYDFSDDYWGNVKASGREFAHWMATDLIKHIESHYNVSHNPLNRCIGGSSMGGLMALYMGVTYPNIYGKSICVSPYIDHIYARLYDEIVASNINNRQFYLSFGGLEVDNFTYMRDYVAKITLLQSILTLKHNQVFIYSSANAKHCEANWEEETPIWVDYLAIH